MAGKGEVPALTLRLCGPQGIAMRVLVIDLNAIITDYERAFWQSAGATGNWQLARVTPGVGGMAWVPAQLDNPLQQIM